ncbi:MAG TPA: protein kinase [Tepidiformaceae bacterium]
MEREDVVAGRYRLEELLGNGGFSEVWRAQDTVTGETFALKLSATGMAGGAEANGLLRESGVLERLEHPNIVKVYGSGVEGDQAFMVMEHLEGPSLRAMLRDDGPLGEEMVGHIGIRMALALQAAHDEGVVHNDIKPENIILSGGEPFLADFGVSRNLALTLGTQEAGKLAGTLAYIAPEVLQGGRPNAQSDIYSLGVTLYEALTGHLPLVRGADPGESNASDANRSQPLEQVLERAISPVASRRFRSAAEFHDALVGAAHVIPPEPDRERRTLAASAFAGSALTRLRPPATVQAMGAIVASAALVVLVASAFSGGSPEEPEPAMEATPEPTPAAIQTAPETPTPSDDEKDDKDKDEKKKGGGDKNRGQGRPWALQADDD